MDGTPKPGDGKAGHILVVDDDPATRRMVTSYLQEHYVSASSAADGRELSRHLAQSEPSLIILDLRLGEDDGLDLLRTIRSSSDVPVIITTGHRLDEVDRVVGLELGADDYVTKPFGLRELLARVRALLRRRVPETPTPSMLILGDAQIDFARLTVQPVDRSADSDSVWRLLNN